jgi:nitrogen fixation protein FixH
MNIEQPPDDADFRDENATSSGFNLWPGLVIAMLGGQIILMLVMVYMATSDRSFAVEPDYYRKAIRWDETVAEHRVSNQLGWRIKLSVADETDIYKNRDIDCTITDKAGRPIEGASVEMIAFAHARGSQRTELTLDPIAAGHYSSRLRVPRGGKWEFRIVVRRAEQTYTEIQQLVVDPAIGEAG